jgi:hypothetical protein
VPGPFYFALVDQADSEFSLTFAREDEHLASFRVSHAEGEFAALSILIERPSASLLDPSRKQWAWLSEQRGSDVVPLFFGYVVGIPADLQGAFVTVEFQAKPANYDAQKRALAATLKVAPFWDYAMIDPQMWDDPDAVLEARTDLWHIDRVTHEVTISSIIEGEDGFLVVAASDVEADALRLSYGDAPLRKVSLEMRAMWTQVLAGSLDVTQSILDAFEAAGSPAGFCTSYTGSAVYDTWPSDGDSIGGVWRCGPQTINVADGKSLQKKYKTVSVSYDSAPEEEEGAVGGLRQIPVAGNFLSVVPGPMQIDFRRWGFTINSVVFYDAEISRTEDIRFNVFADVQNIVNVEDDETSEIITISSGNVGVRVGPGSDTELPIGSLSADRFFPTDRGLEAIEFGLAHARALLMRRARAGQISLPVPYEVAAEASCRLSATVTHPGLPGGSATGKIIAYEFGVDGASGERRGAITLACMVGRASSLSADAGTPTYADADYIGPDYQEFAGRTRIAVEGSVEYQLPAGGDTAAVDLSVQSCTVTNGEAAQTALLGGRFLDIAAACDALNAQATVVTLVMSDTDTAPREARYDDSEVFLAIPQGIDLEG